MLCHPSDYDSHCYSIICAVRSVSDFKTVTSYRLAGGMITGKSLHQACRMAMGAARRQASSLGIAAGAEET